MSHIESSGLLADIIQFSTWGERWGSSDYATRAAPGPDGSNQETLPIYDFQIEFASVSANEEHATASEPDTPRRHSARTQNRRSERCTAAKRVEPYRGTPLQKVQSSTTAVEHDLSLAWYAPASSPEGYSSASSRGKRSRAGKAISVPSSLMRHANPSTSDSVDIPGYNRSWPGAPSGSIQTTFPPGGIASPDNWLASSPEDDGLLHLFQHSFYHSGSHSASTSGVPQVGHQASVETSYSTPSGSTPIPGYSYNTPDTMVWALSYPVVTATCQTVPTVPPCTSAPGVNRQF